MSLYLGGEWVTNWTVWDWAWWFSWAPFAGLFLAAFSRGRRIRTVVLTGVVATAGATMVWFILLGGTSLYLQHTGRVDVLATVEAYGGSEAVVGFPVFAALPLVVRNRESFDQALDLSPFQVAAIASFAAVQVYGTVGAYVLLEQYAGIESWTDAFYYVVVTGTTVGYGDATPTAQLAKLFTLSFLVIGTAAFGATFGSLLVPAMEARISSAFGNMNASQLSLLEDHVLVLGYGDLTEPLLEELTQTTDVVVLTPDPDVARSLRERDVGVLTADPTDREALSRRGSTPRAGSSSPRRTTLATRWPSSPSVRPTRTSG